MTENMIDDMDKPILEAIESMKNAKLTGIKLSDNVLIIDRETNTRTYHLEIKNKPSGK